MKRLRASQSPLQFIVQGKAGKVWIYFTIRHGVARLNVSYLSLEEAIDETGIARVWKPAHLPEDPQDGIDTMMDLAGHLSEEIRSYISDHLPSAA